MQQLNRNFRIATSFAALYLNAETGEGAGAAAPAPKLTPAEKRQKQIDTLEKRIGDDTAKLAELKQEHETAAKLSGVGNGSVIQARIGRAETSKIVQAVVLGVKDDENTGSRRYKITYGIGFDQDTAVIQPSQIVSVEAGPGTEKQPEQATPAPVNEYGQPIDSNGNVIG